MNNKTKVNATLIIILLMTSIIPLIINTKPVQAQLVGQIGTSPSNIYGYPTLGPLPTGVTPANTIKTAAYLSVTPNPIGVKQTILVNVWTTPGTPVYFYQQGYTVTIQKPDGTTDTIGPFNSYLGDSTAWFQYTVDQVGTWKFKFENPGTYIPTGNYTERPGILPPPYPDIRLGSSIYYEPSSTDWQNLTVQSEFVYSWPSVPLPTDYWTRPISAENRDWFSIAGNYPWNGAVYYPNGRVLYASNYKYTAWVQAPNTAHIVWRRQSAALGIIGGGEVASYSTIAAVGNPSIIYNGRCFQTINKYINGVFTSVWECYDLQTGQVYWDQIGITAPPTNILYETPVTTSEGAQGLGSSGITVYLVAISGGRLLKYSPDTGAVRLNISLPSFITSGALLSTNCAMYNNEWVLSVQTINPALPEHSVGNYRLINWTMWGSSTTFATRITSNITWPRSTLPATLLGGATNNAIDYDAGISVEAAWSFPYASQGNPIDSLYVLGLAINSTDMKTGATLFSISGNDTSPGYPIWTTYFMANRGRIATRGGEYWTCWDARTGKVLWQTKLPDTWAVFSSYDYGASYDINESKSEIIAQGYSGAYGIDWDNGNILWHYTSSMAPFESPYGGEPFGAYTGGYGGLQIADGKIYLTGIEHSPTLPITRGWHLHCINATTGELLWKITGMMTPGAISDGYLTSGDSYEGYMYVFGKGQSQTTVTAPDTAITRGTGIVIKGTVMDMSPGDQGSQTNPTARLDSSTKPDTVPCVSAASMETQMEYLYMQHPIDGLYHNETITGVPVILTAIGSDGSVTDIGSTTTNGYYGTFGYTWTPPSTGQYTVIASFAGDDSYGSSRAATTVSVGPASTTAPTASQPTAPVDYMPTLTGILAAVVVAIIVSVIALAVVLRKHA